MKLVECPKKGKNSEAVSVRLILVEEQATAFEPPPPPDGSEQALEVVVLVQSRGESSADFVERTARRLSTLERSDRSVGEAVIATGPSEDATALDGRLLNARAVLAHMTRAGHGEIVLMSATAVGRERHDLFDLAGALMSEATGSVSIRVLFEPRRSEPEHKSGIHALLASTRREPDDHTLAAG